MAQCTYVYINHAHLQNLSALSCYLTTAALCYSEVTAYTLAYSVFTMGMDAKVTPTDDTDYSCHIKP